MNVFDTILFLYGAVMNLWELLSINTLRLIHTRERGLGIFIDAAQGTTVTNI